MSFGCAVIEYLGHRIGLGLVEPGQVRVKAMLEFQRPHTRKPLQSFLGLAGYFRKWIPSYGHITTRLSDMMKKNTVFRWSPEAEQAFVALKSCLATKPILRPPDYSRAFGISVDSSDVAIGACLFQEWDGVENPTCFISKTTALYSFLTRWLTPTASCWGGDFFCSNFHWSYVIGLAETTLWPTSWVVRGRRRWCNCDVANQLVCGRVGAGPSMRELQRLVLAGPCVTPSEHVNRKSSIVTSRSVTPSSRPHRCRPCRSSHQLRVESWRCHRQLSLPSSGKSLTVCTRASRREIAPCTACVNASFEGWGGTMDNVCSPVQLVCVELAVSTPVVMWPVNRPAVVWRSPPTLSLLAADQHDVSSYGSPSSAITFAADGYDVSASASFFVLRFHVTTCVIIVERSAPLFELFALS